MDKKKVILIIVEIILILIGTMYVTSKNITTPTINLLTIIIAEIVCFVYFELRSYL